MAELLPLTIAILSIGLRIVGVGYSAVLLYRVRDLRFGFLTLMLTLMAARQAMTLQLADPGIEELPGLIVSGLAVLVVYYLSQYVEQEERIKDRLSAKNDQLRGFHKAIQHAGHGIFITDTDGTIEYANPAVEELTGYDREEVIGENPRIWKSGEHGESFYADMWKTVLDGEIWDGEIINEHKGGEHRWVDMTIAPITDEEGDIERFVAVDTDVTDRKEREQHIQEQNEQLQQLNTTNRILRDINRGLVQAESRSEIERLVCKEFADTDPYSFAWVATRNMVNESLRPSTHAGIDEANLDTVVDAHNFSNAEDIVRKAIRTESPQILHNISPGGQNTWANALANRGYKAVAAIPLVYEDTVYGAVEIVSTDNDAFETIDEDVLAELGRTVAYAINATESKQALLADSVVELEFGIREGSAVYSLANALDVDATLERLSQTPGGDLVAYATFSDCTQEDIEAVLDDVPAIAGGAFVCHQDESALFRLDLEEGCVETALVGRGGVVTGLTVEDGEGRVTVEFSQRTDIGSVVETITAEYGDLDLVARREHERPARTEQEVQAELEEELTDRQLEALRTAYIGGFFDWPRENTGEEVAELMGVSQTTFLQHLRTAQRKTFEVLLDDDQGSGRTSPAR